ncbi:MAG: MFS transporter, partial [Eudoraea sp.]|nr:MFS transporter [Eudoraea sp.]
GDYMARIMSFVTVVFILVPIIAPASGKYILDNYNWQAIFFAQVFFSILVAFWFWQRQPETLEENKRTPLTAHLFTDGLREMIKYKDTIAYTLISGFIVGSFLVYLSTSQQIFQFQYDMKEEFPYIFAGLALTIGSAIFLNGTLVLRLGMRKLISVSMFLFFAVSLLYLLLFSNGENPRVEILLLFFGLQFFSIGFLFGNLRAIAMEPVGHIAGMAAAITGLVSTLMAVPISTFIGRYVTDSALPLFLGFLVCSSISLLILGYVEVGQKRRQRSKLH